MNKCYPLSDIESFLKICDYFAAAKARLEKLCKEIKKEYMHTRDQYCKVYLLMRYYNKISIY